jgi:poly(glycerol-phosphate) alpha-glucosyltransferase
MPKTFFLTLDLGDAISGIESSALSRTRAFEAANLECVFTTVLHNHKLFKNLETWKKNGRTTENINTLSMYDQLQDVEKFPVPIDSRNSALYPDFYPFKTSPVPETSDLRLYDSRGNFAAYCKRDPEDLSVLYINYLELEGIVRRETYDSRGFLSRTDHIQKNSERETSIETYHRPNGSVAMVKRVEIVNGLGTVKTVALMNPEGRQIHKFESETELREFWLVQLLKENPGSNFIVDRIGEYYQPLLSAIRISGVTARIYPVLHNRHTAGDVMSGEINSHMREIFNEISRPDSIIVFSERQKRDIISRMGECEIRVIPHSGKPLVSRVDSMQEISRKIVYPARFATEKQHEKAFEVMKRVVSEFPDAELHLYGFGPRREELIQLINDFEISPHVFLHDFTVDISQVFSGARLSILSSSVEGWPMTVMESLFNSCPVVAFDVDYGPSEMIKNGVNGFLIPVQDVEAMANRVREILRDDKLAADLRSNCISTMVEFTDEAIGSRWEDLLGGRHTGQG